MGTSMMKAARLYGPKDLRLEMVSRPIPKDSEVLVKILANGLCGSDMHFFEQGRLGPFVVNEPYIPGHEAVGRIEIANTVGDALLVGELVVIEPGIPCGNCEICRSGRYNLCPDVVFLSAPPINGTFAEYVAISASMVHRLPEGVTLEEGALVEPLSVGLQACNRARLKPGSTVAILGSGPIGLITMLVARSLGATLIIMIDVLQSRLDIAKGLGASILINGSEVTAVSQVQAVTKGRGVDVVFDTSGSSKAAATTPHLARRGGVVVMVGWPEVDQFPYPIETVIEKELDVRGVNRYCNTFGPVLSLLEHRVLSVKDVISHRFPFDKVVEAFWFASEHRNEVTKIIIT